MIFRKAVMLPILIILSVQGVMGAILYFNKESDEISTYLTSETGKVAGASDTEIIDLSQEIPMMPNSEIASVDTSQKSISVTLESSLPQEEIESYYDDFMLLNDWIQIGENRYKKGNRELSIEITGNLVKVSLSRI